MSDIIVDKVCGLVAFVNPLIVYTSADRTPLHEVLLKGREGAEIWIVAPVELARAFAENVGNQVTTSEGIATKYLMPSVHTGAQFPSTAIMVKGFECD